MGDLRPIGRLRTTRSTLGYLGVPLGTPKLPRSYPRIPWGTPEYSRVLRVVLSLPNLSRCSESWQKIADLVFDSKIYNKVKGGGRLRRPPFREMYIFESTTKSAIFCHDSLHLLRFGRLKPNRET